MVNGYSPSTFKEALKILNEKDVIVYAGGTDLMVRYKNISSLLPKFDKDLLYIEKLKELKEINESSSEIRIGAACKLSYLLQSDYIPQILKQAIKNIASPAIRNMGTIGGNICNASPAGDTLPVLYALDAKVKITSINNSKETEIKDFILGPKKTILENNEILESIIIPKANFNKIYFQKVGARKASSISKVSFVALAEIEKEEIKDLRIAIGSVGPSVVRVKEGEDTLIGKNIKDINDSINHIQEIYSKKITPIDDQRSTANYRKSVALRLIKYFLTVEL